jgi:hypothetical protein
MNLRSIQLRRQPPPLKWDANEPKPPRETPDALEL